MYLCTKNLAKAEMKDVPLFLDQKAEWLLIAFRHEMALQNKKRILLPCPISLYCIINLDIRLG